MVCGREVEGIVVPEAFGPLGVPDVPKVPGAGEVYEANSDPLEKPPPAKVFSMAFPAFVNPIRVTIVETELTIGMMAIITPHLIKLVPSLISAILGPY